MSSSTSSKTLIKLRPDGHISIRIGEENFSSYLAICRSISVRKWVKRDGVWVVPLEQAREVVKKFAQMPHVEIDDGVLDHANRLTALLTCKMSYHPTEEEMSLIKTKCMGHQASWLGFARYFKALANLCEQGTGKSKMALDWLSLKECHLVLMICRNSNCYKWAEEVRKHSDYIPFVLKGTRQERTEILRRALRVANNPQTPVVTIINYDYIGPFKTQLSQQWDAIVCDESTAIKSTRTKRSKALYELSKNVKYKAILTGTPLINSPQDAYGQFKFLNPNIFGPNEQGFRNRYIVFGGWNGYEILGYRNIAELQDKIGMFSFRVLKRDCLDLPEKIFQRFDIDPPSGWKKHYMKVVDEAILELGGQPVDNTIAISKINRCLQICDGFLYNPDGSYTEYGSPKLEELEEFLEDHFQTNNKVIIWVHFTATREMLQKRLSEIFPWLWIVNMGGGTPVKTRQELINLFNDAHDEIPQKRCIILQTAAFMHGIDLRCDTAIYYSRSWSGEEWLQSQDRIHGINRGGERGSTYIIFNIQNTAETSVHMALEKKRGIAEYVLRDTNKLAAFLKGIINDKE